MKLLLTILLTIAPSVYASDYKAKYTPTSDFAEMNVDEQKEFDILVDASIERLCFLDGRVRIAQSALDRQKEIGKLSGTVDLKATHDAAGVLVDLKPQREQILGKYKELMGKELKSYNCD